MLRKYKEFDPEFIEELLESEKGLVAKEIDYSWGDGRLYYQIDEDFYAIDVASYPASGLDDLIQSQIVEEKVVLAQVWPYKVQVTKYTSNMEEARLFSDAYKL